MNHSSSAHCAGNPAGLFQNILLISVQGIGPVAPISREHVVSSAALLPGT